MILASLDITLDIREWLLLGKEIAVCVLSSLISRISLSNGRELFCVLCVDCRHTVCAIEGIVAVCVCARETKPTGS